VSAIRPDLLPTADELSAIRAVAVGRRPADLIVRGGRVLHVHTGEFLEGDVVICGRHIAAVTPVGRMRAAAVIDATGRWVTPTFIDAHLHIEYTMLTPGELGRLIVPRGTTTVLCDADAMANVAGMAGIELMGTTGTPLRIFDQITPKTPPFPELGRGGAVIEEQEVLDRLGAARTVTLGEGNPFDYSAVATNRFRTALASGRRITGHSGRQADELLWGYLAAGVGDDHNAATLPEVIDRVRLGAMITVMSGSMNDNIDAIFADPGAVRPYLGHMCFCADDKHVTDLSAEGHIDHSVRKVIAMGIDPATAYRMATWQPAAYYRIDHITGSLTPGRLADLQLLPDLADARPDLVIVGGQAVAADGVALFANEDVMPAWTRETIRIDPRFSADDLRLPAAGGTARVQAVEMYDGYFKRGFHVDLPVRDGAVQPDVKHDVLKFTVVNRHHGDGPSAVGFVRGFGLAGGALAVSSNCPDVNVVAVGASDADIAHAVHALDRQRGGFVAVRDGEVLAAVPLPIGGLMADEPWERTADRLSAAHATAAAMGCAIRAPFMVLSFVGLVAVPDFGLTERGLVDVFRQEFAPLLLQDAEGGVLPCRCASHDHPVHALADRLAAPPDGRPGEPR
jgi:adenine deaminase